MGKIEENFLKKEGGGARDFQTLCEILLAVVLGLQKLIYSAKCDISIPKYRDKGGPTV